MKTSGPIYFTSAHLSLKVTAIALVASLGGCASAVPSGTDGAADAAVASGTDGGTDAAVSIPDGARADDAAASAGETWDGYIESFQFLSRSDHVRIAFAPASGDGPRVGTVVFGMGTPPPPPTDPTVGYPPGTPTDQLAFMRIIEGFAYPIVTGSSVGSRVQVSVDLSAPWADWCALQTPIAQDSNGDTFGCMPNTGFSSGSTCSIPDPMTHENVPVDCGRLYLCEMSATCSCDATRCGPGALGAVTFDFHVTQNNGDGTVMLNGQHNVHLTR